MTILTPMRPEEFESFADEAIESYAKDNAQAGRWPISTARTLARADFDHLLPQKLETPNHFIYEIDDAGQKVGFLWFAITESNAIRSGYVYSIRVKPEFRGRGYAKAALDLIEAVAAAQGLTTIGLHVFSFNTSAQALYRSTGYGITGMNMLKPIRRDGA